MSTVIVSGSRRITEYRIVDDAIRASRFTVTKIIEGGQRTWDTTRTVYVGGVDYLAWLWGVRHEVPIQTVDADWQAYGKAAGPIRNRRMAGFGTHLIAIPDRESRGTTNMVLAARLAGFTDDRIFVHYDAELFPERPPVNL